MGHWAGKNFHPTTALWLVPVLLIPPALIEQLSPEGRLVIPLGGGFSQTLTLIVKEHGKVVSSDICSCVFVPLIGDQGWEK